MRKFIGIILLASVSSAFAQADISADKLQKISDEVAKRFAGADADHDGMLTRDEAKGKMPRVYKNFETIDADKRGYVTLEQIKQFAETQVAAKRSKSEQ